jgi:hypothetical protein
MEDFAVYGDLNTHLMGFVTYDGYGSTGCYGTVGSGPCGFMPATNAPYAMNMSLPAAHFGQFTAPPEMAVQTWNPGSGGNWYVYIDGQYIGYFWQYSGFPGAAMEYSAGGYQVGGEVYDNTLDTNSSGYNGQYDQSCMGGCINPQTAGLGYDYSAYAYWLYYIEPGYGSQQCAFGACCSGGWCYTAPSLSFANQGFSTSLFGYSTSLSRGASNWGPYFYFGGGR